VTKTGSYDPQSGEKDTVKWLMKSKYQSQKLLCEPLAVEIDFAFVKPKSARREHHTVKPDIDNLVKFYLDCANGVLWTDDACVVEITARKFYAEKASTRMVILAQNRELLSTQDAYLQREEKLKVDVISELIEVILPLRKKLSSEEWAEVAYDRLNDLCESFEDYSL